MTSLKNTLRWPLRQCKLKCLVLLTIVLLTLSFMQTFNTFFPARNSSELDIQNGKYTFSRKYPESPQEKIVHLDLKGGPPKIEYLLQLISFVKGIGATGILMEYEDMFPYKDDLEGISALNAYTPSDVAQIEETAKNNQISIIPLIPTFGHVEFVLKLEKFRNFREVDLNPETICPNKSGIYAVLQRMIDQVLEVHRNSKYVHIGCDEVELVGVCTKCQNNMKTKSLRKIDIILQHIRKVAGYINATYPGVRAIVWGNEVVKETELSLFRNKIPDLVDVMLSNYEVDIKSFPTLNEIRPIAKIFPNIWIAGAYKGTAGPFKILPDVDFHLVNSRFWKYFIEECKGEIIFKGIVLTGQQRPSHFEVLSELLPVSLPSMAINLQLFQDVQDFDYELLKRSLTCSDFVPLDPNVPTNLEQLDALHCDFPGFEVYRAVFLFFKATVLINRIMQNPNVKYITFYNILHGEGRPSHVRNFPVTEYKTHLLRVEKLEGVIHAALTKFYDNYTVNEWIMTYVIPLRMNLQLELTALSPLVNKNVWARRPLTNDVPRFNAIFNNLCPENDAMKCSFGLLTKHIR